MNKQDIVNNGFKIDEKVTLQSFTGIMENVAVKEFDICPGNVMAYFPEANILVNKQVDEKSRTPGFKSTIIKIYNSDTIK